MSDTSVRYDVLVIGAGPAGQKAAVQGAKAGQRVLIVERDKAVGGECVHRGTIPSKTLRESAIYLAGLKQRASGLVRDNLSSETKVKSLMKRQGEVLASYERYLTRQLERNGIELWHGRARFVSPNEIEVTAVDGTKRRAQAQIVLIATGSRPRKPADIPVDHEHILDSDSILSLIYLPASLVVFGAGVIAAEFATIFQALGVAVTMVDKGERPLSFLDAEITNLFVAQFEKAGGRFLARQKPVKVEADGLGKVVTELDGGETICTEKALVALGRIASLAGINLEAAGLALNERGFLSVDAHCRTAVPHIYAAGDVIGPPALATASMEQGRRAIRHALGLPLGTALETIPVGIYTVPEMASVGLSEAEATQRFGGAVVGRAHFAELARGQINGDTEGLLKLVADPRGQKLLGAQIIGEGAAELIHLAQMALIGGLGIDAFVDNNFNFPTLAEGYRVAALEIAAQRTVLRAVG
ncbi:MAG: Si-specific NAD(P)(+) transhydrogenase [Planctomycetota bacterium]